MDYALTSVEGKWTNRQSGLKLKTDTNKLSQHSSIPRADSALPAQHDHPSSGLGHRARRHRRRIRQALSGLAGLQHLPSLKCLLLPRWFPTNIPPWLAPAPCSAPSQTRSPRPLYSSQSSPEPSGTPASTPLPPATLRANVPEPTPTLASATNSTGGPFPKTSLLHAAPNAHPVPGALPSALPLPAHQAAADGLRRLFPGPRLSHTARWAVAVSRPVWCMGGPPLITSRHSNN